MKKLTSTESVNAPTCWLRSGCVAIFLLLASTTWCRSADVVLIRSSGGSFAGQQELQAAIQFYGLNFNVITAKGARNDDHTLSRAVERRETLAVAITAEALAQVDAKLLLRALSRRPGGSVPLLILGLTPETNPTLLKTWSGGVAVACTRMTSPARLRYVFGGIPGITAQLTNLEIPFSGRQAFYFVLAKGGHAQSILKIENDHEVVPVFIENSVNGQRVFLDCGIPHQSQSVVEANKKSVVGAFEELAPALIFVKLCAGARGWHAIHHYANLTIDDANLREPYGFLDYDGLLMEMEKHNFHTTIAFIPWNYDRTEPKVVALVRSHPERFSICIHGDNHDHKEFTDYNSKPLSVQVSALRQSLARMGRFQTLTGIPYDKVMVFPHSVAPEKTFEALKMNNYLATVNSGNIPMGSIRPPGILFALRPVTLSFADFPSILRYSVAVPTPTYLIAINDFLDNPLFFYCHHELFEHGIDAFDQVADRVNKLDPETRWRSLADIVRHLYFVKLRDDSNYDVLAFSRIIDLENTSGRNLVFYVMKRELGQSGVAAVILDGHNCPFQLRGGYLHFSVTIPAHQTRSLAIEYERDSPSSPVSITKTSFRVYCLRMASNFRDNVMYRSAVGRMFINSYYNGHPEPTHLLEGTIGLILACACAGSIIRVFVRRGRRPG